MHFNPRSPHGERPRQLSPPMRDRDFNPRSPHGERPKHSLLITTLRQFQSTLPAWGATIGDSYVAKIVGISIHAPRMGSDANLFRATQTDEFQSTLPAWGATYSAGLNAIAYIFQSTLPAWGATYTMYRLCFHSNISIHAPRMGSDCAHFFCTHAEEISIHAPRMGSDTSVTETNIIKTNFNPRSPHGERRTLLTTIALFAYFNPRSPHGERRGERRCTQQQPKQRVYFNPRSPHGERRTEWGNMRVVIKFQSTLPAWGATRLMMRLKIGDAISIHAPRMGSDQAAAFPTDN